MEPRRFSSADSADPLHLLCWLGQHGHHIDIPYKAGGMGMIDKRMRVKRRFYVDGKVLSVDEFLDLVDEERKKNGLEPIRRRK